MAASEYLELIRAVPDRAIDAMSCRVRRGNLSAGPEPALVAFEEGIADLAHRWTLTHQEMPGLPLSEAAHRVGLAERFVRGLTDAITSPKDLLYVDGTLNAPDSTDLPDSHKPKAAVGFSCRLQVMPKIWMVSETDPKLERGVGWLAFALAIGAASAYLLVWLLLPGDDGCGPPGHTTTGRIFEVAPFVFPCAAAGILLAFGSKRRWSVLTLAWGAITIIVISGMLEVLVLLLQIGAHMCTQ